MKKVSRPASQAQARPVPKAALKPATRPKGKAVAVPRKPTALAGDLLLKERISFLSSVLDETSRRLLSRLRREIEETEEALLRQSEKKKDKAIRLIDALQVKPAKGRRKDLKKIDLLIGELQKLTEEK